MKNSSFLKICVPLLLAALPVSAADTALSDANIAAIVVAANSIDIKAGQLAQKSATHPEAKGLGDMMVRDHTAVNQQATELVTKLKVTPQENELSKKLKADAEKTYDGLKAKQGAEFDRAYVANEVAYHEAVISVLETMLIPGAHNAELKALLQQVLPAFHAHLAHAKHVQSLLK